MASASDRTEPGESLRAHLRAATMATHDMLDATMQAASGWQTRADYARFLAIQHAARAPIEAWLAEHAPPGWIAPPPQTPLLARDLDALGRSVPPDACRFEPRQSPTREQVVGMFHVKHGWIGTAWVLAGSALGNRAIARQVHRIGGGTWPTSFLGDDAMMVFWQALRTRIERPAAAAEAAAATRGAEAVFTHFLDVASGTQAPLAACDSLAP